MIDYLDLLRFLHVICFVYWLGGDLGVFIAAKFAADPERDGNSRRQFFRFLLVLDIFPRPSLIAILWLGIEMSVAYGFLALGPPVRFALGGVFAVWLWMVFTQHMGLLRGSGETPWIKKADLALRGLTALGLVALFFVSVFQWGPVPLWLGLKALAFLIVLVLGRLLSATVGGWIQGFAVMDVDPAEANMYISKAHKSGSRYALALWAGVAVAGFLGIIQPG